MEPIPQTPVGDIVPTEKDTDIDRIIDQIQTGLVELFDLFKELRRQLRQASVEAGRGVRAREDYPTHQHGNVPNEGGGRAHGQGLMSRVDNRPQARMSAVSRKGLVTRVLDDFAQQVETVDAIGSDLAQSLERVRATVITPEYPNEGVARDMDVVLRFLRARGPRGIRPQERSNILKRIQRWKMHLLADISRKR